MAYHLSLRRLLALSALCSLGSAHSKIQKASCDGGKTSSIGMGTNPNIPIDGEDPTPFQLDSPIIRTKEKDNLLVNGCGRTKLQTNIDVANETEIAIQNNQIANCKPGDTLTMTVFVVNTDGSGPYFADIDEKSNVGIFRELGKVDGIDGKNGIQRNAFTAFDVQIPLPTDMKCEGGKDLNACTLRIRNLADAGPFGGCVALQDVTKGGAGNGGAGNGGAGNGGAGNGGVGNGGNGGNGGLGNGDQGNNDLGDGGLGGNGGQGNKGQGNKGQGNKGQGNKGQGNGGLGNGDQGNNDLGDGGLGGNGGQGNKGQGNKGQGNKGQGNAKNPINRRGMRIKRAENAKQGGKGGDGSKNTGTGNRKPGNGNQNTGAGGNQNTGAGGNQNTGAGGNQNTGAGGNQNTGTGGNQNSNNGGVRSPDDITTADTLDIILKEQQISLKSLEDFLKNGGKNQGGNPQNGQNNAGNGQTGGNQTGGTQTGGTQTGGTQTGGTQTGGNQIGGNQKGGKQKGGN
ncbi:putative PPE family protein PPE24 [Metarhizium anisopliae]|nr:putative PPE family protein PPE24 [Metarhizium anisopliae]